MSPKLQKYIADRERKANRVITLQGQIAMLDRKITEMERLELQSLLSGANMTYQDLTAFIRSQAGQSVPTEEIQEVTDETD